MSVPLAALLLFHKGFEGFWLLESQQPFSSRRIASQMLLMGMWGLSVQLWPPNHWDRVRAELSISSLSTSALRCNLRLLQHSSTMSSMRSSWSWEGFFLSSWSRGGFFLSSLKGYHMRCKVFGFERLVPRISGDDVTAHAPKLHRSSSNVGKLPVCTASGYAQQCGFDFRGVWWRKGTICIKLVIKLSQLPGVMSLPVRYKCMGQSSSPVTLSNTVGPPML